MSPAEGGVPAIALARRRRIELAFLPAALEIIETPASPAARLTAGAIAVFFVAALAWSVIGHVDIIATATGGVVPAGRTKVVQPLETGKVKAIMVEDGDHVAQGQVLVVLDVTEAAAERERIARDLRQARLDAAGLRALRRDLATGAGLATFVSPDGVPAMEVVTEQAEIAARRGEQMAKLAGLRQQIAGKQAEAEENDATIEKLAASLPFLKEKRDLYRALMNVQFTNRVAWLDAEQGYVEGEHNLAAARRKSGEIAAEGAALERQVAETEAAYAHDVLKDLAEAERKEGDLAQQFVAASHRAAQTVLTAPIAGTAQQLAIHSVGGVVTPAEELMTIVPDAAPVLIEAMVENRDVGFVHAGQAAEIKVETFPFTRYGLLSGHVVDVSRSSVASGRRRGGERIFGDEGTARGKPGAGEGDPSPAYVAHIALDRTSLLVDGHAEPITPGMAITAEIKTGRRRVIDYLLAPLREYVHDGMRER